jgi:hypothetical protein
VPLSSPGGAGGGGKKGWWIGLGVLAVAVVGLVAFLATRGGDDDDSSDRDRDRTEDDRDNRDDRDGRDDQGGNGDPEDAVDVARDLVQALIEGDCDAAARLSTDNFAEYGVEDACGEEAPEGTRITDARLDQDDPVVVVVTTEVGDESGDIPLLMVYEDGDWLVDDFSFDVPDIDVDTTDQGDDTGAPATGEAEDIARAAVQAVIDRDCPTVLALGTVDLVQGQAEELCTGELLPADTTITDVETVGDDPLVVSVEVDAGGDSFDIELTFVENQGLLLIDDYQW